MASVDTHRLNHHSCQLLLLQAGQIGVGITSQFILLARWSPHPETDLFLLVSGVPWLVSAALLISGLEMALPAAYHRTPQEFLDLLLAVTILIACVAALISGVIIVVLARQADLPTVTSLIMGILLGLQIVPMAAAWFGRGVLVAREQLGAARLTLLMASLATALGYLWPWGRPALVLSAVTFGATAVAAFWTWRLCGRITLRLNRSLFSRYAPELKSLVRAMAGISAAAGLVHLQLLVERAAIYALGTGYVAAFNVAGRGYEAGTALVVAGLVMPAYPHWAKNNVDSHRLLGWSLRRVVAGGALMCIGATIVALATFIVFQPRWTAGRQTSEAILVLLPRFWLLTSLQPLILKHFAQGRTWPPVIGSLLGIGLIAGGAVMLLPQTGLIGMTIITTLSVVPGWLILGWYEGRSR